MPEGVELLGLNIADGLLTIDVSGDILDYGGSAFERALAAQLVQIAAGVPGVDSLSLRVDGLRQPLAYGTEFDGLDVSYEK